MYVDSHAHLEFEQFDRDREEVVERALAAGVQMIVNVGTDLASSRFSVGLAQRFREVYAAVGIHPHSAKEASDEGIAEIASLAQNAKVVAIGEIGLDYAKLRTDKRTQMGAFLAQVELARELHLPVIIHNREADEDILAVVRERPGLRGVFHFFSSPVSYARSVLEMGFYVSFAGPITFKQNKAPRHTHDMGREVVRYVPLERMLIETDSPFAAPEPHRGKRNEPVYVIDVAREIAKIKDVALEEVAKVSTQNAQALFGLGGLAGPRERSAEIR